MAIITLEVENEQVDFLKELLSHLKFVQIKKEEQDEDTTEEVVANISPGIKEIHLTDDGMAQITQLGDI